MESAHVVVDCCVHNVSCLKLNAPAHTPQALEARPRGSRVGAPRTPRMGMPRAERFIVPHSAVTHRIFASPWCSPARSASVSTDSTHLTRHEQHHPQRSRLSRHLSTRTDYSAPLLDHGQIHSALAQHRRVSDGADDKQRTPGKNSLVPARRKANGVRS